MPLLRRSEQLALSQLVRLIVRRHTGTARGGDTGLLARVRDVLGYGDVEFNSLCAEIVACVEAGWRWNSRWREWRAPEDRGQRGRPAAPCFLSAWELARLELLSRSPAREPTKLEVADRLRRSPVLSDLAGVGRYDKVDTLARRRRRRRYNYVRPVC